ncbi:alpha-ketoglutarate decarboxylase [Gillisia sp. Q332]|uniref:alpha-ketoglutarate decarboxylase n=1 Tax=Gillisia xinjiangensis TaxID=3384765 RepID=UPI00391BD99E
MTTFLCYSNRRLLMLVFTLIIASSACFGQIKETEKSETKDQFWQQVRFGGSLGLSFGNGNFTGALAPSAIYDFNNTFSAGIGLSGAYSSQNNFKATSLGGSLIGMMRPIREVQLSAEFEQLNITRRYEFDGANIKDQDWVPALFLGVGYNTGPVITGVRYDVLHDKNKSFYSSPFMPFVSVYF